MYFLCKLCFFWCFLYVFVFFFINLFSVFILFYFYVFIFRILYSNFPVTFFFCIIFLSFLIVFIFPSSSSLPFPSIISPYYYFFSLITFPFSTSFFSFLYFPTHIFFLTFQYFPITYTIFPPFTFFSCLLYFLFLFLQHWTPY